MQSAAEADGNIGFVCIWTSMRNSIYDLMMALDEKSGDYQSPHPLGTMDVCKKKLMAIHPIVVEIFQSGPKWRTV